MSNENKNNGLTLGSLFDGIAGFPYAAERFGIETKWTSEIEPAPSEISARHFPNAKQLGDVTKINGAEIEPVDIISFGSPCFPAGTLVLTDKGYIEIEKLHIGMKVLTHTGKWQKITDWGYKQAKTVILRGNHYGLECTPNHPIFSTKESKKYPRFPNGKRGNQTIIEKAKEWIQAKDMSKRLWAVPNFVEYLPIPTPSSSSSNKQKPMPTMNENFFYFVGRWIGDGWLRNGQRSGRPEGQKWGQIFLCDDLSKESELTRIVESITDHYCVERCNTVFKVKFCSQVLCEWLNDNFGKYAKGKYLPSWVYSLQPKSRGSLLQGVFDSDGYKVKDSPQEWKVNTISKKLSEGLRILGEIEGYSTTVYKTIPPSEKIIEGRNVNQSPYYTVHFHGKYNRVRKRLSDDLHSWYRVKSITETNEEKTVYNITVENDNSYVAEGIVVHNCQDMSVAGNRAGLDGNRSSLFHEAVRIIREMRNKTNGEYPTYAIWENVTGAFSSNKGEDFRRVLEEITETEIPVPQNEKWAESGMVELPDRSVAWRTFDAQFWGTPQRRRRIYLVADFRGQRAAEILFKPESVSRDIEESGETRQRTSTVAESGS